MPLIRLLTCPFVVTVWLLGHSHGVPPASEMSLSGCDPRFGRASGPQFASAPVHPDRLPTYRQLGAIIGALAPQTAGSSTASSGNIDERTLEIATDSWAGWGTFHRQ